MCGQICEISNSSNSYISIKTIKTVIKPHILPKSNNVISIKVGRNVNLLFISICIEKIITCQVNKMGLFVVGIKNVVSVDSITFALI